MEAGADAHGRIAASLVATQEELALADRLLATMRRGETEHRSGARDALLVLAAQVSAREQGRPSLVLPRTNELAAPILDGLRSFSSRIADTLHRQLDEHADSRRRWLGTAVASTLVTVGLPALVCIALLVGLDVQTAKALLPFVVLADVCSLAVSVVALRVFQVADETVRRLSEKQLSLAFLDATVEFSDGRPDVSPVLERSFDMFLKHYEASKPPIGASDLVPFKPRP